MNSTKKTTGKVGRFFARLGVGMLVTFVAMAIFMGPDVAVFFVGLSIVCTAGISLVVWIPTWWGIGATIFLIISAFSSKDRNADVESSPANRPRRMNHNELAIVTFIKKARMHRKSDEEISGMLIKAGWNREMIDQGLNMADGQTRQHPV